jgi:hypothetical protein
MAMIMTNLVDMVNAFVEQIPGMGNFRIHEDDDQKDLMWHLFHIRFKEQPHYDVGYYVYCYEEAFKEFDFPMWTNAICNEEGDVIYLYKISE